MSKLCKIIILLVIVIFTAVLTNLITLKYAKVNTVNEKDDILVINSFGQNWVYEY